MNREAILSCNMILRQQKLCIFRRLPHLRGLIDMRFSKIINISTTAKVSTMEANKSQLRTLIVGLGNYTMPNTRHSIGMNLVNHMVRELQSSWQKDKGCLGDVAIATIDGAHQLIFLKPRLFMNVNGQSILKAVKKFNISADDIYLIHDDLDLPLGKFTIKYGGSARGHNGVRSAMNSLQSQAMSRLRIGIGRPTRKAEVTDYVLSNFTPNEQVTIEGVIERASKLLLQNIAQPLTT
ncbi:probable peptidyl-tRNA hydrolase [Ptychodera flava]|uniref:probable peptidyl-tRNA hydrolase n=1 Tax=Ptychodera flava TaxID=63121 RepID=UPI00396A1E9F